MVLTWKGRDHSEVFARPALCDNRLGVLHFALDWARTIMRRGGKLTVCLQNSGTTREWRRTWALPKLRARGEEDWSDHVEVAWRDLTVHIGTFPKEYAARHRDMEAEVLMNVPRDPEEGMFAEVQAAFVRRAVNIRKATDKWVVATNQWEQLRGNPLPYDKWSRAVGRGKVELGM